MFESYGTNAKSIHLPFDVLKKLTKRAAQTLISQKKLCRPEMKKTFLKEKSGLIFHFGFFY
jgi:hypothetical protein